MPNDLLGLGIVAVFGLQSAAGKLAPTWDDAPAQRAILAVENVEVVSNVEAPTAAVEVAPESTAEESHPISAEVRPAAPAASEAEAFAAPSDAAAEDPFQDTLDQAAPTAEPVGSAIPTDSGAGAAAAGLPSAATRVAIVDSAFASPGTYAPFSSAVSLPSSGHDDLDSMAALAGRLPTTPAGSTPSGSPLAAEPHPLAAPPPASAPPNLGNPSVYFEANAGQVDSQAQFIVHAGGYHAFLTDNGPVFEFASGNPSAGTQTLDVVRFQYLGSSSDAQAVGQDRLAGYSNYLVGGASITNVPHFGSVSYANVFSGIDVVYHQGNQDSHQLEYDYVLHPGADPNAIRFQVQGAQGLSLDERGNLVIATGAGSFVNSVPTIYQTIDGAHQPVAGRYTLLGNNEIGFQVNGYDRGRSLTIDPSIAFSTYLGGGATSGDTGNIDNGTGIAVDSSGNSYVTGYTQATNFPTTTGVYQTALQGGYDAFVTKFNSSGGLVWSTYLGGTDDDRGLGIALDTSDSSNVKPIITGRTLSTNFVPAKDKQGNNLPTYQSTNHGSGDAFLTELKADGTDLRFATYLGGSQSEDSVLEGAVAWDPITTDIFVTGDTTSPDGMGRTGFPTTSGAFQPHYANVGSGFDAFVSRFGFNGTSLTLKYSSYLGGDLQDHGRGISVWTDNTITPTKSYAWITGDTNSNAGQPPGLPPGNGTIQDPNVTSYGNSDAFSVLVDFDSSPSKAYPFYLYTASQSASNFDQGNGIALYVDTSGSPTYKMFAHVTGLTNSTNFPTTTGAYQTSSGGGQDAFFTKLEYDYNINSHTFSNPSTPAWIYSTYLGGSGTDSGNGIALYTVSGTTYAYLGGGTSSTNFPTLNAPTLGTRNFGTYQGGANDAFVTKIKPAGGGSSDLIFSSFLGGNDDDQGNGIAVFANANPAEGQAWTTGYTRSPTPNTSVPFPTVSPITNGGSLRGVQDAFVTKLTGIP